ncbi:hypothetical protein [Sphingomonas sp.]|uniref:hypothetical protein n=1 Tax=Sphingomonas sp. TaxID=28214 RepID=UPI001DE48200|nr:hypothetical protein [Sphingomonas sp.]MBX9795435.1 hypothetical protein [Sphingomonas sp.]
MDLNYLLARHQISLMRAKSTACEDAQLSHRGMARGYAGQIRQLQQRLGTGALPLVQG